MAFFKPFYMTNSFEKAKKAKISRITDQALLYKITQEAYSHYFIEEAIEQIDDDGILLRIVNSPKTMPLAERAIKRMKDKSALLMIFRNEAIVRSDMDIRLMALIRLDQPLEGQIIHEAERLLEQIEQFDKEIIKQKMWYHENFEVRNNAWMLIEKWYADYIEQLDSTENEEELVALSKHCRSNISEIAVTKLPYPGQRDRLVEIFMNYKLTKAVRKAAYDKLSDNEPEFDSITVCPYCKCVNSVIHDYLGLICDMYIYGYACESCNHGRESQFGEKDFSVPYRDYIRNNSLFD